MARPALPNECIATFTSDGFETKNWANAGDFVVKNTTQAGEEYLLSASKFEQRYLFLRKIDEIWSEYLPQSQILAVELTDDLLAQLHLPSEFYIIARWGSKMAVRKNDFLAAPPDLSEVYRIARNEFFETYTADTSAP